MIDDEFRREWKEVTSYLLKEGARPLRMGKTEVLKLLRELRQQNVRYFRNKIETESFIIRRREDADPEGQLEHNGKGHQEISRAKKELLKLARGDFNSLSF